MERQGFPDRIVYHYRTDGAMGLQVAHGVWGGLNPHGEIEICFYNESDVPPERSEQQIGADGMPGPEYAACSDNSRHIERRIHTRLILNYDTASAVRDWLEERLAEMDAGNTPEIYDRDTGIRQ